MFIFYIFITFFACTNLIYAEYNGVFSLFSSGSNVPEINSLANDDNNKTTSTEEKEILSPDEYLSATTVTQYDTSLITDEDSQFIVRGTIIAPKQCNALEDAEKIYYSNNDPKILINILPFRTGNQRRLILEEYMKLYQNGNRWSSIKQKWIFQVGRDPFKEAVHVMMLGSADETFVWYLKNAFWSYFKTAQGMVTQVLVIADQTRIKLEKIFNEGNMMSLETYIKTFEKGEIKAFHLKLLQKIRVSEGPVSEEEVLLDVDALITESTNWKTERNILDTVLMERSRDHIVQLLTQYPQLLNDIKTQLRNDFALINAYTNLIDATVNPVSFIATRIYSNLNEDDIYSTMIMFVTSFSETCLPVIKNEFEKMYGISMKEYILENGPDVLTNTFLATIIGDSVEEPEETTSFKRDCFPRNVWN